MTSFGDLFLISLKAIVVLVLQYTVGVIAGYKGIIKESDLRGFSSMMSFILVPVLSLVSLGRGLSVERFRTDGWVLAIIGVTSIWEFALIGYLLRKVARPPPQFHRLFLCMVALPNVVAIPLSISQTLCELGSFDAEFDSRAECVLHSRTLVFMYISLVRVCAACKSSAIKTLLGSLYALDSRRAELLQHMGAHVLVPARGPDAGRSRSGGGGGDAKQRRRSGDP